MTDLIATAVERLKHAGLATDEGDAVRDKLDDVSVAELAAAEGPK